MQLSPRRRVLPPAFRLLVASWKEYKKEAFAPILHPLPNYTISTRFSPDFRDNANMINPSPALPLTSTASSQSTIARRGSYTLPNGDVVTWTEKGSIIRKAKPLTRLEEFVHFFFPDAADRDKILQASLQETAAASAESNGAVSRPSAGFKPIPTFYVSRAGLKLIKYHYIMSQIMENMSMIQGIDSLVFRDYVREFLNEKKQNITECLMYAPGDRKTLTMGIPEHLIETFVIWICKKESPSAVTLSPEEVSKAMFPKGRDKTVWPSAHQHGSQCYTALDVCSTSIRYLAHFLSDSFLTAAQRFSLKDQGHTTPYGLHV
ncbi:hypothetical protein HDU96_006437 [Phlyctochytrium bullatum]|nr:hypothetical protein HDU96_006437 [Phlyctochytrium bullatum]